MYSQLNSHIKCGGSSQRLIHTILAILMNSITNLNEPLLPLGYKFGMRFSLHVSREGAEPPILGVAVDKASRAFILYGGGRIDICYEDY